MLIVAFALLSSALFAQETPSPGATTNVVPPAKKKAKAHKQSSAVSRESAAVSAVVEKHLQQHAEKQAVLQAQVDTLLANVPTDAVKLAAWRKQLRTALDAQRKALEDTNSAMRAEISKAMNHPVEGDEEP